MMAGRNANGMVLLLCLCLTVILTLEVVNPGGVQAQEVARTDYAVPDYLERWGAETSDIVDFVYYFPDAPLDLSTAATLWQPVMKEYMDRLRFPRPLRTMFFKQKDELERLFASRPVALAFLPLDYFLENHKRLGIKPYSAFKISADAHYTVILMVKESSPFHHLEDLRGAKLATTMSAENQAVFLNRIVFAGQLDVSGFFSQIIHPQDSYSTIQALRIGLADAALIPEYNRKILEELDPAYRTSFRTLFTSKPIPSPPFVYFEKNISASDLLVFLKVTQEIDQLPAVKQALMFLKLESIIQVTEHEYRGVRELWERRGR